MLLAAITSPSSGGAGARDRKGFPAFSYAACREEEEFGNEMLSGSDLATKFGGENDEDEDDEAAAEEDAL